MPNMLEEEQQLKREDGNKDRSNMLIEEQQLRKGNENKDRPNMITEEQLSKQSENGNKGKPNMITEEQLSKQSENGNKDRPNRITEKQFYHQLETEEKDFSQAEFDGITFSNCSLDGCDFSNATFNNCQFVETNTKERVNFRAAEFRDCEFKRNEYVGADFRDSIVSGSVISDTGFEKSDFSNANFDDGTKNRFVDSYIMDSKLNDSNFANTIFEKCNLSRLECQASDFRYTQLRDSVIAESDFTQAKMAQSVMEKDYIAKTRFVDADLSAADMNVTEIKSGTEFHGVNFTKAKIKNCLIEPFNQEKYFSGASIKQTWMGGDYIENREPTSMSKESADDKSIRRPGSRYVTRDGETKKEPRISPERWTDLQKYQFTVDTDLTLYGKVQDDTKEYLSKMGYRVNHDGLVVKGQQVKSAELLSQKEITTRQEKRTDGLQKKISDKLDFLRKKGSPMRVCPNGQIYITPEQLELFTPEELHTLSEHYVKKALTDFKRDPNITELPGNVWNKIRYMQQDGGQITITKDGRVILPLLSLRFFKNNEIATIQSFYQNRILAAEQNKQAVQTTQVEKPIYTSQTVSTEPRGSGIDQLPTTITRKFAYLKRDGCPMRVCPNGQVYIDPDHLRYFTKNELKEINRFYSKQAERSFKPDRSIHRLSEDLKEKVKLMEQMTGKKLVISVSGKTTLPTQALPSFTDNEIAELNSYFCNHPPRQMAIPRMAPLAPEP